tara:strand:+ start:53 stop:559 length:507 start_codon:yes stop_codon:yes gene_type:complete
MIAKLLSRIGIEIWRDIPQYEGHYQVSNLGKVRSLKLNRIKDVTFLNNKNRFVASLYNDGVRESGRLVSVISAIAFLNHKPCGYKIVVDHIDNNPLNDRLYNLQLITQRENLTKDKKNKSGYTGVYSVRNRYYSLIRIGGEKKYLGVFSTKREASEAYQNELKKIKQK